MRSIWKGPFINKVFIKILWKLELKNNDIIKSTESLPKKIWSRNSLILPSFIGFFFSIYNGIAFKEKEITEFMIGDKFGQYFRTRKRNLNRWKKKKNKKKKKK